MAAAKKVVKKSYRISNTENVLEYTDGTWAVQSIGPNNQVIDTTTVSAGFAERKLRGGTGLQETAVSPSQYKVKQSVRIDQTTSLIQKDDGTWIRRRLGLNNDVVSESPISAAEAKKLIDAGRVTAVADRIETTAAQRGAVSPGGGQPSTVAQLERNVTALENATRNAAGDYLVNGQYVLPAEYKKVLKQAKDELAKARGKAGESAQTATVRAEVEKTAAQDQSVALGKVSSELNTLIGYANDLISKSTNRTVVSNARAWKTELEKRVDKIDSYLKTLGKTMRVDPAFVAPEVPTFDDIDQTTPPQPFQPSAGQDVFGGRAAGATGAAATTTLPGPAGAMATIPAAPRQPSTGPISAAGRGEAGIGAPARTGEVVSTPFGTYRRKPDGEFEPVYKDASGQWQVGFGPAGGAGTTPAGQAPAGGGTVSGGGAGGGAVGGTTTGTVPPAGATGATGTQVPADWEQAAREAYGAWFDAIRNIPEMRDFINQLMTGPELSEAQFMAKLQQTNWWRTTTAAAREFARRQVEDPATLQTQIDNQVAALRQEAMSRGIRLPDAELVKAATDQIKFGWSDQVTLDYIGGKALGTTEGVANLRSGFYGQQIRETAAKYGVPMSDTTLNKWVADVATGQQNIQSFEAYARDLAKNLFPALAGGFDRGLTFPEMTAPYAQFASQILEIPSDTIDFTRPEWARAFTMRDQKGEQRQMSYGEWFDYLRTDQRFGWEFTDQARSQAYSVANDLARMFGRSA